MCCISLYSWRCVYTIVPLQGPIVWHMVWLGFVGQKAHIPVTAASPWLWVRVTLGRGRKKIHHPHTHCPTKMNKNWKTTCKVRLIQEHLQYADVFFCTLCLLNCLWLRASVMKLYVLVERAASPFQLGPGRSLLSGFCKTFFLIHVLMNKWSPWSHFFHICVNCFKSILSCHKKAQLICWA